MKKVLALLLSVALIVLTGALGFAESTPSAAIASQTVPLYLATADKKTDICLYFKDGQADIPYIDMDTVLMLIQKTMEINEDDGYQLTMEQEGEIVTLTRENGSQVSINFAKGEISWDDYNRFTAQSYSETSLDILGTSAVNENGEPELFRRNPASFVRRGHDIEIHFSDFFIELLYEDGKGYMPLQTVSDLFLACSYLNIGYNGEAVFLIPASNLGDMRDLYYAVPARERSEALAHFNYCEMCLSLQFNYGLKDEHDIPSFGTLFALTGMEEKLKSPDAVEANTALYDVVSGYLDDLHSRFNSASPYAGDVQISPTVHPISMQRMVDNMRRYNAAITEAFPDGVPAYMEIGNTAYVTFNSFDADYENDYYAKLAAGEKVNDTIGLIMYAHSQITRKNSPIENVVLDLSFNSGGLADAAIYTIAWFLGECTIHATDAITGAQASMSYNIDVNGDRVFDESDSVANLNRYCIISPISFSCGNLVPSVFKSSSQVTLLGRRSGGGACAVQPLATADGSIWQVSGRIRLSTLANGSFYAVDQGVEPDLPITKTENFYDREGLTAYINGLI